MFDTHAHLEMINDAPVQVLERARAAGVNRILTVGTTDDANTFAVKTSADHEGSIYAAVGYDRDQAVPGKDSASMAASLLQLIDTERQRIVAIGETGLDFHYRKDTEKEQIQLFEAQLDLASKLNLPVIVHSRESEEETMASISRYPATKGIIHCFTGSALFAKQALDAGFMISFSGILTFKKAQYLRDIAADIPPDMILVETDSPYLAPEPHRGRKNEPSLLPETVKCLASVRGVATEEMAQATESNALRLFGIS